MTCNRSRFVRIAGALALTVGLVGAGPAAAGAAGGYGAATGPAEHYGSLQAGSILVSGEGEVEVEPDEAIIHLSATGRAPTALEAQEEMQSRLGRMYEALRTLGYREADVRSRNSSLTPRWSWEGGERTLIDYEANTAVEVTVNELDAVAVTVQGLVESGIDEVHNVEYRATDIEEAYARALTDAVEEALWKGETIAAASGQRLVGVLQIEEIGAPGPVRRSEQATALTFAASSQADAADLQPGTITVEARVRVELQSG